MGDCTPAIPRRALRFNMRFAALFLSASNDPALGSPCQRNRSCGDTSFGPSQHTLILLFLGCGLGIAKTVGLPLKLECIT